MPLNKNHKNFINTSIDHLLNFTLHAENSQAFIENLNELLAGKVDEQNEHYFLSQCLLFPEKFLPGLEQQGEVRVGRVQAYIAKKITNMLKDVAASNAVKGWGWDGNLIQRQLLKNKNFFQTEQQIHDNLISPMWSLPVCSDRIYTQNIRADYSGGVAVFLQVSVNVDPVVCEEVQLTLPYFQYDEEEEAVVAGVMSVAERRARGIASRAGIRYLRQQGQLYSDEDVYLVQHNVAAKRIITHQYWFDQLLACDAEDYMFACIARLTPLHADNLTSRSVIDLMISGVFEVGDILNIHPGLLSLIEHPFYFAKFRAKEWDFEQFEEASEETCKVLSHPRMASLLQRNLMTLGIAFALPLYLLRMNNAPSLLTCAMYDDYFSQQPINWGDLLGLREDHCLFLMNADVASIVLRGDLSIGFIATLNEEVMMLLNAGVLSLLACRLSDVMQLNAARLKYMFNQMNLTEDDKSEIMKNITRGVEPDSFSELLAAFLHHITEQLYDEIFRLPVEKRSSLMGLYRLHSTWMERSVESQLVGLRVAAEKILVEDMPKRYLNKTIFFRAVPQDESSTTLFCKRLVDSIKLIEQAMPDLFHEQQVRRVGRR
ncbi:MAG: hypothetical protein WAW86_00885 [Gammaproteobacteria bacterium]